MRALLTGHKGFIGRNLLNRLEKEYSLIYEFEKDDIPYLTDDKLSHIIEDSNVVFHNGAISDTSLQDYREMLYYNYHFSKRLIDLCKYHNTPMIFAGSASIYGTDDKLPQNIYAWSKMITEEYGRGIYPEGFTSLRYFNVYGPGEEDKGKMASVAYQAWKQGSFRLFPKEPKRDFVFIDDVVEANIKATQTTAGVYDVGYGEAVGFETFLDILNIPYEYTSEDEIPEWYQFYTCSHTSKWLPNWRPKYSAIEGCEKYKNYLISNGKTQSV